MERGMEKATRVCIKCGIEKSLGHFADNWRHKVNTCNECKRIYDREYYKKQKKRNIQNKMYAAEKRAKELKELLDEQKESGIET